MLFLMMTGGERLGIQKPICKDDQTLLQNYIEWYGVFYTLSLSFIIGQGWKRYLKINSEIDREADALSLLLRTSEMCGKSYEEMKEALSSSVALYIAAVKSKTIEDQRTDEITAGLMKQIHNCVKNIVKQRKIADSIKSQLLQQYCDAFDARGDRLDLVAQKLPPIVWLVLVVVSFTWLWGFVWLEFQTLELNLYISICTLGWVSFLFFTAWQLNDVTKGRFRMDFSSFYNFEVNKLN
jgi:hypothetical protein